MKTRDKQDHDPLEPGDRFKVMSALCVVAFVNISKLSPDGYFEPMSDYG